MWNINLSTRQNIGRRQLSTTVLEASNPPMNDMRWNIWRQLASAAEATVTGKEQHKKGPFLFNTPEREKPAEAPPHTPTPDPEPSIAPPPPANPATTPEATTSDEEWYELFDELVSQVTEEREGTPPLIITTQPKGSQENRWIRFTKKTQTPMGRFIETEGKKRPSGRETERRRKKAKVKKRKKGRRRKEEIKGQGSESGSHQ
jgi:hypothetical protein